MSHARVPLKLVYEHLVYPPSQQGYRLPWLTKQQLRSFEVTGVELRFYAPDGWARALPSKAPLVIAARPVTTT